MLAADVTCNPVDALAPGLRFSSVALSNAANQPKGIRLDDESVKLDALQLLLSVSVTVTV